ncbi:lipocalin-like domain-containing protein [Luteibacter sp. 22Crub2.1]|uniref:lipocalin-like domain-containing protein n=1 Tax=Luteibacter sp. 22Crub2.1 TaxID=1283288 RepID=UPI0009A781E9|nr:lipocalin-like domain-containing protein [Luteibacter sp. 22Crub2.1]SKB26794.1 Predicted secreted hydrolase [Luteibacter sp. 22Crub2.1]
MRARVLGLAAMLLTTLTGAVDVAASDRVTYTPVSPDAPVALPRDHGAHPGFRTEWWYVTGWLRTKDGPVGFQITFFRSRLPFDDANPSRFAPRQAIVGHVALSDPATGHIVESQRLAREGFGLAEASTADTDVTLGDWRLRRDPGGSFATKVSGEDFTLDLTLTPGQPALLQGDRGYSRKGPGTGEASAYFSLPHLKVGGRLSRGTKNEAVQGEAWLDREWSSSLLDPRSVGWDWAGLNMDDGSAVTVFRVRDEAGHAVWAGGSVRGADGTLTVLGAGDVAFEPRRRWHSPRTGADYPVETDVVVTTPTGKRRFTLRPLFDDQELDTRRTGGPVYWEGAVRTEGGRGYLELVGYGGKVSL